MQNFTPVLIDSDRSASVNKQSISSCGMLHSRYNSSVMYSILDYDFESSTVKDFLFKLDFRQLAIMLLDLLNNSADHDYNQCPSNLEADDTSSFLKELYKGMFNEHYYTQFLNNT